VVCPHLDEIITFTAEKPSKNNLEERVRRADGVKQNTQSSECFSVGSFCSCTGFTGYGRNFPTAFSFRGE